MTNKTTTQADLQWAPDVLAFAIEHGVDQHLPRILEMTRQVFPSARRIDVRMEEDAEDADDWRIVYEVHAPLAWSEFNEYLNRWCAELFECCPSTHSVYVLLRIEVV